MSLYEANDFERKYIELRNGHSYFKSKNGDCIILVGNKFGINNKLVFLDGNKKSIKSITKIGFSDETNIDKVRSEIIDEAEQGRKSVLYKVEVSRDLYGFEVITEYERENFLDVHKLRGTSERTTRQRDYIFDTEQDRETNSTDDTRRSVKLSNRKDSEGNTLTENQEKYFADSKVRDENGNLKVMYHGTPSDFTIFDTSIAGGKNGSAEGFGLYFADTSEVSRAYGGKLMKVFGKDVQNK